MAQIDIDKFVISLRRCFGEDKGIATTLDRCLFSQGLKYVDTPTGGRLERADQPTMLEKIMWGSGEQKPTEWSKEDERLRTSCIKHIEEELERIRNDKYGHSEIISDLKESCRERINWLKSLRPQSTWKPSDEQLESLYDVLNPCDGFNREVLESLYQDLKKLKE